MNQRKPGGRYASKRKEPDVVELLSGVENSTTTGEVIEISIQNSDAKSKDYSFLPNQPRPGHQDMNMMKRLMEKPIYVVAAHQAQDSAPIVASSYNYTNY